MTPLQPEVANQVYDVLVGHAGAPEGLREMFIYNQAAAVVNEWRFQGRLGFGGKVYRERSGFRVSCYREDRTPERDAIIEETNAALNTLVQTLVGKAEPTCIDVAIGEVHPAHPYIAQVVRDGQTTLMTLWCEGVEA